MTIQNTRQWRQTSQTSHEAKSAAASLRTQTPTEKKNARTQNPVHQSKPTIWLFHFNPLLIYLFCFICIWHWQRVTSGLHECNTVMLGMLACDWIIGCSFHLWRFYCITANRGNINKPCYWPFIQSVLFLKVLLYGQMCLTGTVLFLSVSYNIHI